MKNSFYLLIFDFDGAETNNFVQVERKNTQERLKMSRESLSKKIEFKIVLSVDRK